MRSGLSSIFHKESAILGAILLLALINGLIYVFLLPPWQHYDEPNHFEYVWLLAHRHGLPQPGDFDTAMRQAVAQSMIEQGFFDGTNIPLPDLTSAKPWIGAYPQLDDPPLYYFLASLPVRLFSSADITIQLYAARLVSLGLFLITIVAGWGLTAEITSPRHPLRFMVPLSMSLLPAYVDLMTAVNNDVGAIAAFSLFLWGSVRLIRRGPSLWTLLWVVVATGLCLMTKRTVYIALPLSGIALLFAVLRGRFRKVAWGLIIFSGVAVLLAVFTWGDATLWYRDTTQNIPTRVALSEIPDGEAAFRLFLRPGDSPVKLLQILPVDWASEMSGKVHTLGAWIWASQPLDINSMQLVVFSGDQVFGEPIQVDQMPRFFAFTFMPEKNTGRAWVTLDPGKHLTIDTPLEIYYDGVVLAEGSFSLDVPPDYVRATWNGIPYKNLIRNGSAEQSWFYLRPWAEKIATRLFSDYAGQESFSLTVYTLIDWSSTGWYYRVALETLFRTFWAKFAWGHVPLMGAKPYRILLLATLLGFAGLAIGLYQQRKRLKILPWDAVFFLGLNLAIVWGMTLFRGTTYILRPVYFPVARYVYPAIIPMMFFLCVGWLAIWWPIERKLHLPEWVKYLLFASAFLMLDIYSIVSILHYYG